MIVTPISTASPPRPRTPSRGARTVAVLNTKGGTGKTTISVHLARLFQLAGHDVRLIDSDPQGSAVAWSRRWPDGYAERDAPERGRLELVHAPTPRAVAEASARPGGDLAIIDGAAKLQETTGAAVRVADVVVIPVQPSALDLWAVRDLAALVAEAYAHRGRPVGVFVVSRARAGTILAREVEQALTGYGLDVLPGRTHERVAYAEAIMQGRTVLDLRGAAGAKAREEVRRIGLGVATRLRHE
jgi:chromosome partitioning protein